ncbi:MAG: DNA methyltransferase [Sedimentisphaerales bacterium]|jgi:site-specific DNA-methyltransferase (adenine-specific)
MGFHKIIIGDSRKMHEVEDESVHLIITSPPYWQLKDYGQRQQIGYNDSYQDYINNLNLVWNQCHRVLHKGCRLCINIGDQFARSVYYGRYKIIPIRTEVVKFCESVGFDYMGAIIWQKVTTCNTTGGATVMGSFPYPRNGIIKLDYEFILIFKKLGKPPKVSKEIKEKSRLSQDEWNQYFYGHWNFSGEKQNKHLAPFPEELPKRLIKMFSFIGDTVLDPFLGSGTTSLAALRFLRNSIGYEINEQYLSHIKQRLTKNIGIFEKDDKVEVIKRQSENVDFKKEISSLPYVFMDPVTFERKIDPKLLRFGSRIDGKETHKERYYTVKKVISPSELILDTGAKIHLIGVKSNGKANIGAVQFLKNLTKGQKVFLRFDEIKHDENNNLYCYLYLKNKTFVNAHLLKNGLVDVDTTMDYKMKSKFIALTTQSVKNR